MIPASDFALPAPAVLLIAGVGFLIGFGIGLAVEYANLRARERRLARSRRLLTSLCCGSDARNVACRRQNNEEAQMGEEDAGRGQSSPPPPGRDRDALSTRLALILLLSVFVGVIVGLLTFAAGYNLAGAILAGLFAGGAALMAAPKIIR